MSIDIDKLERLARAAAPAPWEADRHEVKGPLLSPWLCSFGCRVAAPAESDVDINATATYIAACSPDVVLALVEEVRRLREVCEENERSAIDALRDDEVIGPAALLHCVKTVVDRAHWLRLQEGKE